MKFSLNEDFTKLSLKRNLLYSFRTFGNKNLAMTYHFYWVRVTYIQI